MSARQASLARARRLITLENDSPFQNASQRRLVIVADDERAARATLDAIRWFKTRAPQGLRDQWSLSALLLAHANDAVPAQKLQFPPQKGFFDHPDEPESRYAWRWVTYQAPDLVLQLRGGDVMSRSSPPAGSLAAAMVGGTEVGTVPAVFASVRETDGPAILEHAFKETNAARTSEIRVDAEPPELLASRWPSLACWRTGIPRTRSSAISRRLRGQTPFVWPTLLKMMRFEQECWSRRGRGSLESARYSGSESP